MYGLVLVVGDLVDRIGRRTVDGRSASCVMAVSNAGLVWLDGIAGMSLSLFGLGLGWSLAYVAATTELVDLAGAVRARPADRLLPTCSRRFSGAALALGGGVVYTGAGGSVPLALSACGLAVFAAAWVAGNRPDSAALAASARA